MWRSSASPQEESLIPLVSPHSGGETERINWFNAFFRYAWSQQLNIGPGPSVTISVQCRVNWGRFGLVFVFTQGHDRISEVLKS